MVFISSISLTLVGNHKQAKGRPGSQGPYSAGKEERKGEGEGNEADPKTV